MNVWNTVMLVLNIVLFILIVGKIAQFTKIYQDNLQVQHNIEELAEQNARLVDLILDELEGKIQEARMIAAGLEAKPVSVMASQEPPPLREIESMLRSGIPAADKPELKAGQQQQEAVDESFLDEDSTDWSKIFYMRQMGMSVQEIAEKLQVSQGEIDLKLNLEKRKNLHSRILRKLQ